ncbi:hypothetical protein [Niveibacterium terrae]|uniref:hypothetical protein n=1 Tax=Niveibacterium terrae TaxID=3373598 RepID=UPI003A8D5CB8
MPRALLGLLVVLALTVVGAFVKNAGGVVGLPNVVPVVRDPLLLGLGVYGFSRLRLFESRIWPLLIGLLVAFSFSYIISSMVEDRVAVGLYYIRLYLLPMIFYLGLLGLVEERRAFESGVLLRVLLWWNALLFVSAAALYALLLALPSLRPSLFGPDLLPTAWFISGGRWMRMGLPAASPNNLGLFFALNAFVFIRCLLQAPADRRTVALALILALLGLVLTFSRSSMLVLFIGAPLLVLQSGGISFSRLFRLLAVVTVLLILATLSGMIVDAISDGYVTRWLILNLRFQDPSMVGHLRSITDAVEKFDEYWLAGYPRGTVGPKAVIFSGVVNNVENSLLAVFFDMGLMMGGLYVLIVALLAGCGYRHSSQLPLLISFLAPCMLLPYVFEVDVLIYFAFIYILLGQGDPARGLAGRAVAGERLSSQRS